MKSLLKQEIELPPQTDTTQTIPLFGYELLREILIPDILGKDTPEITYWAGKHLARKFPLLSIEEMISFFNEAGWGELQLLDEKRNGIKLELSGTTVERRFHMNPEPCFRLEAGFIAHQFQTQKRVVTEAYDEVHKKQRNVIFLVRWDRKDSADEM